MLPYKKRILFNIKSIDKQKQQPQQLSLQIKEKEEQYEKPNEYNQEEMSEEEEQDDNGIDIEKTFKAINENYKFKEKIIEDVLYYIQNGNKGTTQINFKKNELIKEYIRFMILKAYYKDHDSRLYQPSFGIEIFWQIHCLNEIEYKKFCSNYLNNIFIRPNPDSVFDKKKKNKYQNTLNIYHQTFGNDINERIWPSTFNGN